MNPVEPKSKTIDIERMKRCEHKSGTWYKRYGDVWAACRNCGMLFLVNFMPASYNEYYKKKYEKELARKQVKLTNTLNTTDINLKSREGYYVGIESKYDKQSKSGGRKKK